MELNALTLSLLIIVGIALTLYLISSQRYEQATVLEVLDGDSIMVKTDKHKEGIKVRLLGIDAPEKASNIFQSDQRFARQAMRYVEEKLPPHTKIYLEYDRQKWDQFGRLLAYIYINKTGKSINSDLIRNGYAFAKEHKRNKRYQKNFERLQEQAKRYQLGLWRYYK